MVGLVKVQISEGLDLGRLADFFLDVFSQRSKHPTYNETRYGY